MVPLVLDHLHDHRVPDSGHALSFEMIEVLAKVVVVLGCMLPDSLVAFHSEGLYHVLVTLIYLDHPWVVFLADQGTWIDLGQETSHEEDHFAWLGSLSGPGVDPWLVTLDVVGLVVVQDVASMV